MIFPTALLVGYVSFLEGILVTTASCHRNHRTMVPQGNFTRTTAEPRVNAYIPDDEHGLPKVWWKHGPLCHIYGYQTTYAHHMLHASSKPPQWTLLLFIFLFFLWIVQLPWPKTFQKTKDQEPIFGASPSCLILHVGHSVDVRHLAIHLPYCIHETSGKIGDSLCQLVEGR